MRCEKKTLQIYLARYLKWQRCSVYFLVLCEGSPCPICVDVWCSVASLPWPMLVHCYRWDQERSCHSYNQGPGVVTILQGVVGAFSLIVKTDGWFAALVWSNLSPVCHGSPYFNSPQQEAGTLLAPGGSLPLVFCNPNIDAHVWTLKKCSVWMC